MSFSLSFSHSPYYFVYTIIIKSFRSSLNMFLKKMIKTSKRHPDLQCYFKFLIFVLFYDVGTKSLKKVLVLVRSPSTPLHVVLHPQTLRPQTNETHWDSSYSSSYTYYQFFSSFYMFSVLLRTYIFLVPQSPMKLNTL